MTAPLFELTVRGKPEPQGSKTRTRWGMREDNENLAPWRSAVTAAAVERRVNGGFPGPFPLDEPLLLSCVFTVRRPAGHYGTGRNAGRLKPGRESAWPRSKPDVSKLARAVEDALTDAGVWVDDAQVIGYAPLYKTYVLGPLALDSPGVWLVVRRPS